MITDAIGCVLVDSGSISRIPPTGALEVFSTVSQYPGGYNVSATGAMDGDISLGIIGGTPPYDVVWQHGDSTTYISGLAAGYYEAMVSDAANAVTTVSFTLIEPQNGLSVQLTGSYNSCSAVGDVSAMVNGGTPPYTYQWNDMNGEVADAVWAMIGISGVGTYGVWVKDANNDSLYTEMDVLEAIGFSPQASSPLVYGNANASCSGSDGSIIVNMGGNGVPPYTIEINILGQGTGGEGQGTPYYFYITTTDSVVVVDSLKAGTYDVKVSDQGSCGSGNSIFIELNSPPPLKVDAVTTLQPDGSYFSCPTCTDATLTATAQNGTAPYTYSWMQLPDADASIKIRGASMFMNDPKSLLSDPNAVPPAEIGTTATLSNAAPDTWYAVMVTDQLGCEGGKALTLERVGTGVAGATGVTGVQGATGITGSTGAQGIAGNDGAVGAVGPMGPLGLQGPAGADGTDGANGTSVQIQGSAATSTGLPSTGMTTGDGYLTQDDGHLWVWDGAVWNDVGVVRGPAGADGVEPAPAWRLGGNTGTNNWLGTSDATDVVMKANGQTVMKLGADGVTEVTGGLRLLGLGGGPITCGVVTIGADGTVGAESRPCPPPPECQEVQTPWSKPPDNNALNIALCNAYQNVGIGYLNPEYKLHVNGTGYFNQRVIINEPNPIPGIELQVGGTAHIDKLWVNTTTGSAKLTVRGYGSGLQKAFEVQDAAGNAALEVFGDGKVKITANGAADPLEVLNTDGNTAFQVKNDGKVQVGFGTFVNPGDRAELYLGSLNNRISAINNKGISLSTYSNGDEFLDALFIESGTGKVGIGVGADHNFGEGLLEVNGTIRSKKVVVEVNGWGDFVFDDSYKLRPLKEVQAYIAKNGHLPDIPPASKIETEGLNLGELVKLQMQKIEELTLYLIELEKKMNRELGEGKSEK